MYAGHFGYWSKCFIVDKAFNLLVSSYDKLSLVPFNDFIRIVLHLIYSLQLMGLLPGGRLTIMHVLFNSNALAFVAIASLQLGSLTAL